MNIYFTNAQKGLRITEIKKKPVKMTLKPVQLNNILLTVKNVAIFFAANFITKIDVNFFSDFVSILFGTLNKFIWNFTLKLS